MQHMWIAKAAQRAPDLPTTPSKTMLPMFRDGWASTRISTGASRVSRRTRRCELVWPKLEA